MRTRTAHAVLLALSLLMTSEAMAHGYRHGGPRARVGVYFGLGVPLFWPYYHPYYGYPPYARETIIYDSPPAYWYFCREANGYYPYVSQCPGGWEKVPATPPAGSAPSAGSR